MGEIIYSAILPHPPVVIPKIGEKDFDKVTATVQAMQEVAWRIIKLKPDTIIIISPHGTVIDNAISILYKPFLRGNFVEFGVPESKFKIGAELDLSLSERIYYAIQRYSLPVKILDTKVEEEEKITLSLDHGVTVPWFYIIKKGFTGKIVSITPSFLTVQKIYNLGIAIKEAVFHSDKKVALIASGDLAHKFNLPNPKIAKLFEEEFCNLLSNGNIQGILNMREDILMRASECGYIPTVAVLGALSDLKLSPQLLSFESPLGVGYLVAELYNSSPTSTKVQDNPYLILARRAIEEYILKGKIIELSEPLPEDFKKRAGVFVCIELQGELRGCMGTERAYKSNLAEEIISNAIVCATADPRFNPLTPEELPFIKISLDILSEALPVESLEELDPKEWGVIVKSGDKVGILLPDIEGVETPEQQIEIARRKGGIEAGEETKLFKFRVTRYSEK